MIRILTVVAIFGGLVGLFFWGLRSGTSDSRATIRSNLLDKPVANFELPLYERYQHQFGETLELTHFEGKPRIINFWASWCAPCRDEAPVLQAAHQVYGNEVQFIGIQTREKNRREDGRAFIEEFGWTFPNVYDDDNKVMIDYGLFGLPETFFVRADGTLLYKHAGPITAAQLEDKVTELLQ